MSRLTLYEINVSLLSVFSGNFEFETELFETPIAGPIECFKP